VVIRKRAGARKRGAALVETAVILGVTAMLILGVFEYGRLLMDWDLLNNAAREGCRYALANNTSTTITSGVQNIVITYMSGETSSFSGFNVTVTGTHGGASTPVNSLGPGDPITVTVSGTYKFMNIVPFINMPSSLVLTSGVTMLCEGGT
jgi:Flp pilus assembly protein TadG